MYRVTCGAIVENSMAYFTYGKKGKRASIYTYNATSSNWSLITDCPIYDGFAVIIINGLLTTVGGYRDVSVDTNQLFSLIGEGNDQKWTEKFPPMPTKRYHTSALCTGTALIVVGGFNNDYQCHKIVEVMNTKSCQWSTAADLPEPLRNSSLTVYGDHLYLLGGMNKDHKRTKSVYSCSLSTLISSCGSQSLGQRLVKTMSRSSKGSIWNRVADLPVTYSTCVSFHSQLLAICGKDSDGEPTTAIHRYNQTSNSWKEISHMTTPRCWCCAAVLSDNQLMIVGGLTGLDGHATDSVEFANLM